MGTFKEQLEKERGNACYYEYSNEAMVELQSMKDNGVYFAFCGPKEIFGNLKSKINTFAKFGDQRVGMLSTKKLNLDAFVINCAKKGYITKTCNIHTCSKCSGVGKIQGYEHIDNGICWKCGGIGTYLKSI